MTKRNLTPAENVEYYLGKDRLPNLHWQPTIPCTWEIPPRHTGMSMCNLESHDVEITMSEGITYRLNNLGYRSNFDYLLEELKTKELILVLGDSDTFARGVELEDAYPTKIQQGTEYVVLNLGIPGLSADGIARVGVQSIVALGSAVKHVCLLWPGFSLREFVSKKFKCGVHYTSDYLPYAEWTNHIDWVSNNYNYQKNKLLIEQTALNHGAKYHDLIINRQGSNTTLSYNEVTSDTTKFTEFDTVTHSAIANYFLRKINNEPSLFQTLQS